MHKARFAELILSLFTSRERAASTVGDLLEATPARGGLWFWWSVARTALSLLWSDFATQRALLAGLAFRGILMNVAFYLLYFAGAAIVAFGVAALVGTVVAR